MKLTGFADEAARDLATQIKATQELGWEYISARGIDGKNIHDLSEEAFETSVQQLEAAGIKVAEFGSLIGNWAKKIDTDFDITLGEIERAIPRMKRLGTQYVRIMSYAQEPWGSDQQEQERFHRLREIVARFSDAGLIAAHENCMNYGGFSSEHTLRLIEEVPGMKLIFDTGNPVFQRDRSKPEPYPWQDAWEFYQNVREHIVHIHIKDCKNPLADGVEPEYVFPGEGQGYVREIIRDLKSNSYNGFIAIEPHVATVFHVTDGQEPDWQQCYDSYVAYGKAMEEIIQGA
ncbi:Sugar phosphate isomerase/epimerase [Rubritalea squalenifaciens DSM 18772]|uniref:Sugar phosphate isomerase/epimerase n=1 Tax=Rubritalea squalenifaciens DSM 18772 TaxID=1123071 RepID=A0A1M6BAG3_9BACT|nr:sugar phosphate isomerase/epimerase family protein [Rubritalea squalenifaciens]SHI45702.1 Sugar phosphate isomerase/epimerase [Rubritalea squalenifaciens DSM 18772]